MSGIDWVYMILTTIGVLAVSAFIAWGLTR